MFQKMDKNVNPPQSLLLILDSLILYDSKYYLQVYLGNRSYKIVDNQMIDYFGDNLFESDQDQFF